MTPRTASRKIKALKFYKEYQIPEQLTFEGEGLDMVTGLLSGEFRVDKMMMEMLDSSLFYHGN